MPSRSKPGHRAPHARIGVLVGFPVYEDFSLNMFASAILRGMRDAARARGVDLLDAADKALYAAKTRGRNRVVIGSCTDA